ncbi:DUF5686 and carboxypeptidase-like regulatory domain-containing protein [Ohtaekwangia sp.]|uniref:DUF5686 and carboxypeptidase-like regulatory domain-containing protein n=1 Tax=Ohtaekwangia sp. TaxID=2066019 RepID=UPI002F93BF2D
MRTDQPPIFPDHISLYHFIFFLFLGSYCFAQDTVVKGKITDANSGDPIPFVNVIYQGTAIGTTTDFNGNYTIHTDAPGDTIVASYIGYKPRKKAVPKGGTQIVNFQLGEDATQLQEIVINAGENPAYAILRNVMRSKNKNDKRRLATYEYDTYTKVEIDVDNITDKFRERKIIKKITQVLDSVDRMAGEDGKPILPIFISESISKFYYRENPQARYENILKSKVNGIGIQDGTLVTQLVGSSFQEYNFYQNWIEIVTKYFVSPIADGWRLYYDYDLTDSVYIGDDYCYRLDFTPKSPQDLAFNGTIWITKNEYALKQIDVTVNKQANLNFVEKIKIQQELEKTSEGPWLPVKNRILIDVSELTNTSAGMLAKFYTSNKNFVLNKVHEPTFYDHTIVMEEDARMNEQEEYWDTLRHEPLTETEKNVYKMIDTLQTIPAVKTYIDIIKIFVNGYYDAGKLYIGPYIGVFAVNNIEGFRLQAGFKTSIDFSNKWVFRGQLGYGFKDEKLKYAASAQYIFSKDKWTTISFRTRSDIGRVGVDDEALADNFIFLAAQKWGIYRRGYYFDESRLNFQRELFRGFTQRIAIRQMSVRPHFNFGWYNQPEDQSSVLTDFRTTEIIVESRFARDELFLQDDNERISLGTVKWPIITLRYTRGVKGVFNSDFDYTKLKLSVVKRIKFGPLGVGYLHTTGEYTFGTAAYPLLTPHLGNQSLLYTIVTYNLMDYGEFVSDRYASLQYQHHFEGFLLNRVPLMRKLKWRLVGSANMIYGGLSAQNRKIIPEDNSATPKYRQVRSFDRNKPYIEVSYGVENIFRFMRVDFVHRLSYLDKSVNPDVRKFGVLVSFWFTL